MTKPLKQVTHQGKTQSITEWSKELGIDRQLLSRRVQHWEKGEMNEETVFSPVVEARLLDQKRLRVIDELLNSIIEHALPKINDEMKAYMLTGDFGPALNLFLKLGKYFPMDARLSAPAQAPQQPTMAQVALIFQGQDPPTHLVRIDDK